MDHGMGWSYTVMGLNDQRGSKRNHVWISIGLVTADSSAAVGAGTSFDTVMYDINHLYSNSSRVIKEVKYVSSYKMNIMAADSLQTQRAKAPVSIELK